MSTALHWAVCGEQIVRSPVSAFHFEGCREHLLKHEAFHDTAVKTEALKL